MMDAEGTPGEADPFRYQRAILVNSGDPGGFIVTPLAELLFAAAPVPTDDGLFELRSIPGNLIGIGHTEAEARASLLKLLQWTKADERSFYKWWTEAWSYVDPGDRDLFEAQRLSGAAFTV